MEYRRDFRKYAAHNAQLAKRELDERIAGLGVSLEKTYDKLRRRLPEFFTHGWKPDPDD